MKRLWIGLLAFLFVASAYGCGCSIGGFEPDEDPVSIAICDKSASGSGTADITCSTENGTVITGGASGGNTISHTPGDDAPGSIPVTVYGSCSHGSSFSTSGSVEYEVEACSECSNPADSDVGNNCIKIKIYLGKRNDGTVAGYFWLYTNNPSPMLSTPAGLTLIKYRDVEELTDINGVLKQVMAPRCFVDIVTNNAFKYSLNFYSPTDVQGEDTNGYYTLKSGCQPFAVWELENPNTTNDYNTLRITKIIGTGSSTNDFTWQQEENGTTAWGLSQGGGLRDDYLSSVTNGSELVKTRTVKNNNGIVASKSQDIYSELSDGKKVLVSKVEDPDGAARTTTYSYYDDEAETGKFGKFHLVVEPTGAWTKYDYADSGLIAVKQMGWLNAATNAASNEVRTINYDYQPFYYTLSTNEVVTNEVTEGVTNTVTNLVVMTNWVDNGIVESARPRLETETIEGKVVSKTWRVFYKEIIGDKVEIEERCLNADNEYENPANLRTVKVYYPKSESAASSERIKRIDYPDGRRETYTYELGNFTANSNSPGSSVFAEDAVTGQYVRVSCVHGTTDNPDGIANKTTKEVTIEDAVRHTIMKEVWVYTGSGYDRVVWEVNTLDTLGHVIATAKSNGSQSEATWNCCGKEWEKDENGVEYSYTYDALKRLTQKVKHGISAGEYPAQADQYTNYTYDAEGRKLTEVVSASGLSQGQTNQFDMAGRLTNSSDYSSLSTKTVYSQDGLTTTETLPGGTTRITERHKDGKIKSITGTAQVSQYHEYGVNEDGTKMSKVYSASNNSPVWVKTTTDLLGRTAKIEKPGYSGTETTEYVYNNKGQLIKTTASGKPDTLYAYDEMGNQIRSGLDIDANGALNLAGLDRITELETSCEQVSGVWYLASVSRIYATDNSTVLTTNGITRQRMTGFSGNLVAETISIDVNGNQAISQTTIDRNSKLLTRTIDVPNSSSNMVAVTVNGLLQKNTSKSGIATTYAYDSLGRRTSVTEPRTGTATTHYDSRGWVDYVEDAAGKRTTYIYDSATSRKLSQTDALSNVTYYSYLASGQPEKIWGSGAYPISYEYDAYGRITKFNTYRSGTGWSGSTWSASPGTADTTEWIYHEASGLLASKKDAAGKEVSYTYTSGGKLASRTWARVNGTNSLSTTYGYNTNGRDLVSIDYSDSTPDVSFTYDRLGRQKTAESSASAHAFAYNGLLLDTETIVSDAGTNVIDRSYDAYSRPIGFTLGNDYSVTYGYDSLGRFSMVSNFVLSASSAVNYSYLPNSDLLSGYSDSASGLQVSRTYEANRNLLTQLKNQINSETLSQFDYANDTGGRRTSVKYSGSAFETGPAFNFYGYNTRSEVTTGDRYWGANLNDMSDPVSGQSFAYGYDNIGNRTSSLRENEEMNYTANNLNQYIARTIPDGIDVLGSAETNSTVTVNNGAVTRHGKYWNKALTVANSSSAAYQDVSVVGVYNPSGTNDPDIVSTATGHVFVAKTPEQFVYDDDGNLLSDGRFGYSWDSENRLVSAETLSTLPSSVPRVKLEFAYDYMSRRVSKTVSQWNSFSNEYQVSSVNLFIYDGWNLVSEKISNQQSTITNYYTWGVDLSGTLSKAGGVGGLLAATFGTNRYVYCYDGKGNVSDLVDANTCAISAHYEFSPFGETIVATGPAAKENSYRFSTKPAEDNTGLILYENRAYSPSLGRWLKRDCIGNDAGSLYGFVRNNPVQYFDYLGLYLSDDQVVDKVRAMVQGSKFFGSVDLRLISEDETKTETDDDGCSCHKCKKTTCNIVQDYKGIILRDEIFIPPTFADQDVYEDAMGLIEQAYNRAVQHENGHRTTFHDYVSALTATTKGKNEDCDPEKACKVARKEAEDKYVAIEKQALENYNEADNLWQNVTDANRDNDVDRMINHYLTRDIP